MGNEVERLQALKWGHLVTLNNNSIFIGQAIKPHNRNVHFLICHTLSNLFRPINNRLIIKIYYIGNILVIKMVSQINTFHNDIN